MSDQLTVRLTINNDDIPTVTPSQASNRNVFAIWCVAIVALVCLVMGLLWQKLQSAEQTSALSTNSVEPTFNAKGPGAELLPEQQLPHTIVPKGLITQLPALAIQMPPVHSTQTLITQTTATQKTDRIKRLPGIVQRAQFTSSINNKEPTNLLSGTVYSNGNETLKIYFFTELKNLAGSIVRHQWYYKNQLIVEIPINVRGNRWRSYSVKHIPLSMLGKWTVKVQDENETTLTKATFIYKK